MRVSPNALRWNGRAGHYEAYCYNSETATMHLHVYERARQVGGWAHRKTLVSRGWAHFEYAQRTRVPGVDLVTA